MPEMSDERRTAMILALEAELDNIRDGTVRLKRYVEAVESAFEKLKSDDEQRKVEPVKRQTDAIFWADPDPRD
jgi:hypothetical protein